MATTHTDAVIRRANARQLAFAITRMADRYAQADRQTVYAYEQQLRLVIAGETDKAMAALEEQRKSERAAMRRRTALARLSNALANMAANQN
jgi:hypothetical protein